MKHLFLTFLLALLAGISVVLTACSDSKKADPTPTTGTVNGQITPAASITSVMATSTATPVTTATATPTSAGAYSFTNLAAGTYTLSFTPAMSYDAPSTQSVTVTAGGTTTATLVQVATSGGTITGQIMPVGSIIAVTASNSTSPFTFTVVPSASGVYSFTNLVAGTYTLSFTPATGYVAPATQTVTVTAGGTTTATAVTATTGSGSSTWTVDGTTHIATFTNATLQSNVLSLSMSDSNTALATAVVNFNSTTTSYSLALNSLGTSLAYSISANNILQSWSTFSPGGSGTITFSSIDTSAKKISGTISANASPYGNATGTKTIAASFTNVTYQ